MEMLLIWLDQTPYLDFGLSLTNFLGGPSWSLISDIKGNWFSVSGKNKKSRRKEGRESVAYLLDHPPCLLFSWFPYGSGPCGGSVSSGGRKRTPPHLQQMTKDPLWWWSSCDQLTVFEKEVCPAVDLIRRKKKTPHNNHLTKEHN